MRLLRLTSSDDFLASIPEEERIHAIASRLFTEATGEPLSVTLKRFWPTPGFDSALERWLAEYDPEMVFFIVPSYPVCYESVPLRIERRLGRTGAFLNAGSQAAARSRFGQTTMFHAVRRLATRTIGGEPLVPVAEMMAYVERGARTILAHEGTVLAIRGPRTPFGIDSPAAHVRSEDRRQHLNRELAAFCSQLHIPVQIFEVPPFEAESVQHMLPDRVHLNARERQRCGEDEAAGMVAAWNGAHSRDIRR
jgi:hypothetical protein